MDLLPWGRLIIQALKHVDFWRGRCSPNYVYFDTVQPLQGIARLGMSRERRNYTTRVIHADTSNKTAMTRLKRPIATAERQNLAAPSPR